MPCMSGNVSRHMPKLLFTLCKDVLCAGARHSKPARSYLLSLLPASVPHNPKPGNTPASNTSVGIAVLYLCLLSVYVHNSMNRAYE